MIWKVEAEGDYVYVEAETIDQAEAKFERSFGKVPRHLVTWTECDSLPEGEETIAG